MNVKTNNSLGFYRSRTFFGGSGKYHWHYFTHEPSAEYQRWFKFKRYEEDYSVFGQLPDLTFIGIYDFEGKLISSDINDFNKLLGGLGG